MKSNSKQKFKMSEVLILVLTTFVISLFIGWIFGRKSITFNSNPYNDEYINKFAENYNYILNNYYKDVDKQDLINGAINGMMAALDDPYSAYYDETETNNFNILLEGEYTGVGIEYYQNSQTNEIIVSGIFKKSSAEKAGLQVGDVILKIDDLDLTDLESTDLSSYIANSNNTDFVLEVKRDDSILKINVSKTLINIDSVESKLFEEDNKKIGYIYIYIRCKYI